MCGKTKRGNSQQELEQSVIAMSASILKKQEKQHEEGAKVRNKHMKSMTENANLFL